MYSINDFPAAIKAYEAIIECWAKYGTTRNDDWRLEQAYLRLYMMRAHENRHDTALVAGRQLLALRKRLYGASDSKVAEALTWCASASTKLHNTADAKAYLEQALALAEKSGDKQYQKNVYWELSRTYKESGDTEKACQLTAQAAALCRVIPNARQREYCTMMPDLASMYLVAKNYRQAKAAYAEAIEQVASLAPSADGWLCVLYKGQAEAYCYLRELKQAEQSYQKMLAAARKSKDSFAEADVMSDNMNVRLASPCCTTPKISSAGF